MKTRTIEYQDEEYHVSLEVSQATTRQGIARQALLRGLEEVEKPTLDQVATRLRLMWDYSAAVAATTKVTNHPDAKKQIAVPMTSEEFLDLPDALTTAWSNMATELNLHWFPFLPQTETKQESG